MYQVWLNLVLEKNMKMSKVYRQTVRETNDRQYAIRKAHAISSGGLKTCSLTTHFKVLSWDDIIRDIIQRMRVHCLLFLVRSNFSNNTSLMCRKANMVDWVIMKKSELSRDFPGHVIYGVN